MLSVLIAARNEVYLEKTIRDVLSNAEGEIEVIVELDGYIPNPQIVMNDDRVKFIHNPVSIGQRQCINHAASMARGEFIMKLDAHCAMDKGFDVKLAKDCEESWTVIPRMYNLDVETWRPKLHKRTDYMYITSEKSDKPFRAMYYGRQPDNNLDIDDTMCCMGPCFFMHKKRFLEQGGCDEGHGGWGQQGVEVSLKAWLSGGSLKVNKKTWFAHWFRGDVGFPYPASGKDHEAARAYSRDLWLNDKWPLATRKLKWVIDKFNPPGWRKESRDLVHYPTWRGIKVIKPPHDLVLYQQVIWDNKPDILIECGTAYGGSALFFADVMNSIGKGHVVSIDKDARSTPEHSRITYINGRTTSTETLDKIREFVKGKSVMVVLDSDHRPAHVKRELHYYGRIVTEGQYMVVEDIYRWGSDERVKNGPGEAVDWYMQRTKNFELDNMAGRFAAYTKGGWLKRR